MDVSISVILTFKKNLYQNKKITRTNSKASLRQWVHWQHSPTAIWCPKSSKELRFTPRREETLDCHNHTGIAPVWHTPVTASGSPRTLLQQENPVHRTFSTTYTNGHRQASGKQSGKASFCCKVFLKSTQTSSLPKVQGKCMLRNNYAWIPKYFCTEINLLVNSGLGPLSQVPSYF